MTGEIPTKKVPIRTLGFTSRLPRHGDKNSYYRVIHRKENDDEWYIYLKCFAHENSKRAFKNTKKNCKSFKLDLSKLLA